MIHNSVFTTDGNNRGRLGSSGGRFGSSGGSFRSNGGCVSTSRTLVSFVHYEFATCSVFGMNSITMILDPVRTTLRRRLGSCCRFGLCGRDGNIAIPFQ